jgi:lipoyl synthase
MKTATPFARKPPWLRQRLPADPAFGRMEALLAENGLHTICQEGRCPNRGECFSRKTATFLILGDRCTRRCGFCGVAHGAPAPPDAAEPSRIAAAAAALSLAYCVVTSVTRDDLVDGGAGVFAETIRALRNCIPGARIEVLIPDFAGNAAALEIVIAARPDVIAYNLETVERLYPEARPQAAFARSLELLRRIRRAAPGIRVKSGMMLGLGERPGEVEAALRGLLDAGCRIITLGQYLRPKKECLPVIRHLPPEEFDAWRETARSMGFERVASGPFVRSSYHAEELFSPGIASATTPNRTA